MHLPLITMYEMNFDKGRLWKQHKLEHTMSEQLSVRGSSSMVGRAEVKSKTLSVIGTYSTSASRSGSLHPVLRQVATVILVQSSYLGKCIHWVLWQIQTSKTAKSWRERCGLAKPQSYATAAADNQSKNRVCTCLEALTRREIQLTICSGLSSTWTSIWGAFPLWQGSIKTTWHLKSGCKPRKLSRLVVHRLLACSILLLSSRISLLSQAVEATSSILSLKMSLSTICTSMTLKRILGPQSLSTATFQTRDGATGYVQMSKR